MGWYRVTVEANHHLGRFPARVGTVVVGGMTPLEAIGQVGTISTPEGWLTEWRVLDVRLSRAARPLPSQWWGGVHSRFEHDAKYWRDRDHWYALDDNRRREAGK